jgi:sphingomyelin phosphodiesterase
MLAVVSVFPNQISSVEAIQPEKVNSSTVKELKILTWNIYMLPFCSFVNGNHRRAKIIGNKLFRADYDIVVLEEAFDYGSRRIIKEKLKTLYPFIYGPGNESAFSFRTNSGIWILSKVPLTKVAEIEFKHRFGIDAMARKGATLMEGYWQGQKFQLVGTHLQADSPDSIRRLQCIEISSRLLKKYELEYTPQIVCGDFNIENDDHENYHYMLNTLEAQDGYLDGNLQASYDELDNGLAKRDNGKKMLIDYVLVRNTDYISAIRRRISVFKEFLNDSENDLSDHYGIEARISFELPFLNAGILNFERIN